MIRQPTPLPTDAQLDRWVYAASAHEDVMALLEALEPHMTDDQRAIYERIRDGWPK